MTIPVFCNLDIPQLVIASVSLVAAIATLIFTILAFCVAKQIGRRQLRREEYSYLLFAIVYPCNTIETDSMLLVQGTIDEEIKKEKFDKEVLLAISKAKSYALMIKNYDLFNYLDGLLTGASEEKMGQLIEDYFKKRNVIVKKMNNNQNDPSVADDINQMWEEFSEKAREMRDQTINKIDSFLMK